MVYIRQTNITECLIITKASKQFHCFINILRLSLFKIQRFHELKTLEALLQWTKKT